MVSEEQIKALKTRKIVSVADKNFLIGCVNVIVFGIIIYAPIFLLPVYQI